MAQQQQARGVLFVCLGNICRSPIAEAILDKMIEERNLRDKWFCDSAATSRYHIHDAPDERALRIMREHGLKLTHKARELTKEDFARFEYIFGMDNVNINDIKTRAPPNHRAKIELLGAYDPEEKTIIKDPYYGPPEGFIETYEHCYRCCKAFLDKVQGPPK